jgi:predicted porin
MLTATEVAAGAKDDIGTEIDFKATYKLAKNLKYWVDAGILMAGDFYGTNPDDATSVRHGLMLTF